MPLIAMTREMGSLGKDVASIVAERMGKPVVYHELIDHLANKMRLRKSHVIRFLEGKANIWERLTTDKTSMAIYTADELLALAASNRVSVIRGWGAAHLLRPVSHVRGLRSDADERARYPRAPVRSGFVENALCIGAARTVCHRRAVAAARCTGEQCSDAAGRASGEHSEGGDHRAG